MLEPSLPQPTLLQRPTTTLLTDLPDNRSAALCLSTTNNGWNNFGAGATFLQPNTNTSRLMLKKMSIVWKYRSLDLFVAPLLGMFSTSEILSAHQRRVARGRCQAFFCGKPPDAFQSAVDCSPTILWRETNS